MERQASSTECWHDDVEAANAELRAAEAELERAKLRLSVAERAVGKARQLKILIVGFGNFGQFIAKTFIRLGHHVIGQSRGDYAAEAAAIGAHYMRDINEALNLDPHVVIFCTSVLSTAKVLDKFPKETLGGRLVVDVLSVKEYPKNLLLAELPPTADILCTHPMFGPQSGKHGWQDLPFVYEKVRISSPRGAAICLEFLRVWSEAGCRMVEMTCEEHDYHAAASQFITHTTGRLLAELAPQTTPINTKGYESLLQLVANTTGDSFDLYCGLFYYNSYSKAQLEKLEDGLKRVKESLFAFEAEQMKEDGGPQAKWVLSPSRSSSKLKISDETGTSQT